MTPLERLLAAADPEVVELHGHKGEPGYSLLHHSNPDVRAAANREFNGARMAGASVREAQAKVTQDYSPRAAKPSALASHIREIAKMHTVSHAEGTGARTTDLGAALARFRQAEGHLEKGNVDAARKVLSDQVVRARKRLSELTPGNRKAHEPALRRLEELAQEALRALPKKQSAVSKVLRAMFPGDAAGAHRTLMGQY